MGLDVFAYRNDDLEAGRTAPAISFRDAYGSHSLASWLTANLEPAAAPPEGLTVFTRPRFPLNTPSWRRELVLTCAAWYLAAVKLSRHRTDCRSSDRSKEAVGSEITARYIRRIRRLYKFARTVFRENLHVEVIP